MAQSSVVKSRPSVSYGANLPVAGPTTWDALPTAFRCLPTYSCFCNRLKSLLMYFILASVAYIEFRKVAKVRGSGGRKSPSGVQGRSEPVAYFVHLDVRKIANFA